MSLIEWSGRLKCVGTAAVALAWLGLFVACLCSVNRSRSVRLVSPMYCFLHFWHSIMYVKFVDLQFICCLISRTSLVLLNVYVVLPSSMWGQVRHPCLELQRKVPCGWLVAGFAGFSSFARTNWSRRLVNADKPQQVFLCRFFVSVLLNWEWVASSAVFCWC